MLITDIKRSDRVRTDLGDIDELAASIKTFGLLQPIRVNRQNELILGGRRLAALEKNGVTELTEGVHFIYEDDVSSVFLREAELEENVRRKSMSWQEQVKAVAKIHTLRKVHAGRAGEDWYNNHTGVLLGVSASYVNYALTLANLIDTDNEIKAASGPREALTILSKRAEAKAVAELAKRASTSTTIAPVISPVKQQSILDAALTPAGPSIATVNVSSSLSERYVNMDCLEFMKTLSDGSVPHIVTDPPYGIEMDNFEQTNTGMSVDSVAATHVVKENESLFAKMVPEFARILKPTGFCVMFCDVMQWQYLYDLLTANGFKVQRWPVVWLKTHQCMNQMAGFNFTKNFELAIVARRPDARLVSPQNGSIFPASGLEGRDKFNHPFVKPAAIWKSIFRAIMQPGEWFFDPFMGEGSSILAGLDAGIQSYGCEIDPNHHQRALVHISNTMAEDVPF